MANQKAPQALIDLANSFAGSEALVSLSGPMAHTIARLGGKGKLYRMGGVYHIYGVDLTDLVNDLNGEGTIAVPPPVTPQVDEEGKPILPELEEVDDNDLLDVPEV